MGWQQHTYRGRTDRSGREQRFLKYLRIYVDDKGESKGEERQMPLEYLPSPGGAVSTWRINPIPTLNVQTANERVGWLNPRQKLRKLDPAGCVETKGIPAGRGA
jgi:hypothetical protein